MVPSGYMKAEELPRNCSSNDLQALFRGGTCNNAGHVGPVYYILGPATES